MRKTLLALAASLLLAGLNASPAQALTRYANIGAYNSWPEISTAEARWAVQRAWGYTISSIPCDQIDRYRVVCWSTYYEYHFTKFWDWGAGRRIEIWRFDR